MKPRHILHSAAALVLLAFAGCQQDAGQTEPADGNVMTFNVTHPYQTRATTTAFETDDEIGLYVCQDGLPLEVGGNYVNNAPLAFDGSRWTPASPIYWNEGTYNVYGYYPYTPGITSVDEMPFSVATDHWRHGASHHPWLGPRSLHHGLPFSNSFPCGMGGHVVAAP